MTDRHPAADWLAWYQAIGVDEAIDPIATDRFNLPAPSPPTPAPRPPPAMVRPQAAATAAEIAQGCATLAELHAAIERFDLCPLKATATRTVISDGPHDAPVMVIGEAPGADEDRVGRPFVGASGQLLDRMLAAIGLDRARNVYITNVVFWRPPGNRQPSAGELALCLPLVERQIVLLQPRVLILSGNISAKTLLDRSDGITRFRGRWVTDRSYSGPEPVITIATYHPSYLLRSPSQKREAWIDLLNVKVKLQELGVSFDSKTDS